MITTDASNPQVENWKDFIEETHCGFNVDPGNPRSFADAMEAIHADESLRSEMSLMARKVAVERFDRGKLANIYLNRLLEEKITPIEITMYATLLNILSFHSVLQLKIPGRAYEVAIGAVIDEVIPAQNNPIDIKYFENDPRVGDN